MFLAYHFAVGLAKQILIIRHLEIIPIYVFIGWRCQSIRWPRGSLTWGLSLGWETGTTGMEAGLAARLRPAWSLEETKDWPESDAGQRERKTHQSDTLIGSLALDDLKNHSDIYFLKSTWRLHLWLLNLYFILSCTRFLWGLFFQPASPLWAPDSSCIALAIYRIALPAAT